nr:hypothetical protein Ade03nite_76410 [Actinoplanes derwentensis]
MLRVVVADVDDVTVVSAEQPDDDRWQAVAQRVAGQLGGHQTDRSDDLVMFRLILILILILIRGEKAVEIGAHPSEVLVARQLPAEQQTGVRGQRQQLQGTHGQLMP